MHHYVLLTHLHACAHSSNSFRTHVFFSRAGGRPALTRIKLAKQRRDNQTAFSKAAFEKVNGYSNEFWGWGAEDDDLSLRTFNERTGFKMVRPAEEVTRFKMIKHEHEANNAANSHRFALVRNGRKFWGRDGLNSLDYEVLSLDRDIFFTNVTVDLHYDSRKTKQWGIERRAINKRSEPNEFFWTLMSSNFNVF